MNRNSSLAAKLMLSQFGFLWLAAGAISAILLSPKINFGIFAWLSPFCMLMFFRHGSVKKKWLWFVPSMAAVTVISLYEAIPFPFPVLLVISLLSALITALIFQLDRWLFRPTDHFFATLFLPAAMATREFIDARGGGGTWGSIANTQIHFGWLIQLASVAGIFGISFLVYWFASAAAWVVQRIAEGKTFRAGVAVFGMVGSLVMAFGLSRTMSNHNSTVVRVGGVSVPSFHFIESLYEDFSGSRKILDPKSSLSSSTFAEMRNAYIPFIETGDTNHFNRGYHAMKLMQDSLFILSEKAADAGAKIISWSEANALSLPFDELQLTNRGKEFAARRNLWLLMTVAVIHTGKITPGKKFLENKAILIGPDGNIANVLHKNRPVPFAEASEAGDGRIPAIQTAFGKISTSICYDADFPDLMRQVGKQKAGLLLLPSGDWWAISPFHSYMAVFRGIENGSSVFRQASGGLSLATDYRGKKIGSMDFYGAGEKLWWVDMPVGHAATIYSRIGDSFVYACMLYVLLTIIYLLAKRRSQTRQA